MKNDTFMYIDILYGNLREFLLRDISKFNLYLYLATHTSLVGFKNYNLLNEKYANIVSFNISCAECQLFNLIELVLEC